MVWFGDGAAWAAHCTIGQEEMSDKEITFATTIGPTHPAFKEPIQLSFELHGEEIVAADFVPGQAHRGVEWMGMRRNPVQILYNDATNELKILID